MVTESGSSFGSVSLASTGIGSGTLVSAVTDSPWATGAPLSTGQPRGAASDAPGAGQWHVGVGGDRLAVGPRRPVVHGDVDVADVVAAVVVGDRVVEAGGARPLRGRGEDQLAVRAY